MVSESQVVQAFERYEETSIKGDVPWAFRAPVAEGQLGDPGLGPSAPGISVRCPVPGQV